MAIRRILFGSAAALSVILCLASAAWACVTAEGPYVNDLFVQQAPSGESLTVRGGGWVSSQPVEVDWRPGVSAPVTRLTSVVADSSGVVSTLVRVPPADPGFYYIALTQGSITRATPFEVVPAGGSQAGSQSTSAPVPASQSPVRLGQQWSGLRAGSDLRGLGQISPRSTGGGLSATTIGMLALMAGLLGVGLCLVIERSRPVRARARQ